VLQHAAQRSLQSSNSRIENFNLEVKKKLTLPHL